MFSSIVAIILHLSMLGHQGGQAPSFHLPVRGEITSPFGVRTDPILRTKRLHSGLDIGATIGSFIRPIAAGRVIFGGPYQGFGNLIAIKHGNNITTLYAHCWGVKVRVGDLVSPSTILGFVGETGRATGPHLHFEVRYQGVPVNPLWVLKR